MEETSIQEDYISLISLVKGLWRRRKSIFKIIGLFFLLGVFLAIFSPKEYVSGVKFLSQTSSSSKPGGNWSGLAALVGINLNANTENGEIPSNIYPKIINSIPFQQKLMETPLTFKKQDSAITFRKYYTEIAKPDGVSLLRKYTIGLPGTVIGWFKSKDEGPKNRQNDSLIFLSKKEMKLANILKESVSFGIDETDGVISISANMPEPVAAAQMAQAAQSLLQKEIIAYRIAKAQDQMQFIDKQYSVQKENFESAQSRLARYQDRNAFNNTRVAQIELNRLQSEYDLSYSVFSELQRQKVAQNIQVKKDTPIFTVINPASVPLEPVAPNRIKILLISLIAGAFFGITINMLLDFYQKMKKIWRKTD